MIEEEPLEGEVLHDRTGAPVGSVVEVYRDDITQRPAWVVVDTASGPRFVPLRRAEDEVDGLQVPFEAALILAAPVYDADAGQLRPQDEAVLYDHYGMPFRLPFDQGLGGRVGGIAGDTTEGAVL